LTWTGGAQQEAIYGSMSLFGTADAVCNKPDKYLLTQEVPAAKSETNVWPHFSSGLSGAF